MYAFKLNCPIGMKDFSLDYAMTCHRDDLSSSDDLSHPKFSLLSSFEVIADIILCSEGLD